MSKGYTKQEVKAWKDWSDSKTGLPEATPEQRETLHQKAMGKHKETKTQYEVLLRYGDIEGEFTVDVREDIVTLDNDPVTEEYIEGFIYNTYDEAKKKYVEFIAQYDTLDTEIFTWNEVEDERGSIK